MLPELNAIDQRIFQEQKHMLHNLATRAREEVLIEIEHCIPILAQSVQSVSMRYPRLTGIFANVLQNRRIVPKSTMHLAPYVLPAIAKSVEVLLGRQKMREYERTAEIYQQLLVAYLKQDLGY